MQRFSVRCSHGQTSLMAHSGRLCNNPIWARGCAYIRASVRLCCFVCRLLAFFMASEQIFYISFITWVPPVVTLIHCFSLSTTTFMCVCRYPVQNVSSAWMLRTLIKKTSMVGRMELWGFQVSAAGTRPHSLWRNWRWTCLKCTSVLCAASPRRTWCDFMSTFPSTKPTARPFSAASAASATPRTTPSPDTSSLCTSWRSHRGSVAIATSRKTPQPQRTHTASQTHSAKCVPKPLRPRQP